MSFKSILIILLGLALIPTVAYFTTVANSNVFMTGGTYNSSHNNATEDPAGEQTAAGIPGITILLPLVGLGLAFGLVYFGFKGAMEK